MPAGQRGRRGDLHPRCGIAEHPAAAQRPWMIEQVHRMTSIARRDRGMPHRAKILVTRHKPASAEMRAAHGVARESAAMSAKASEVSATTMPTATAAVSPAATMPAATATAGACFKGEKTHDDEQHRGNASAGSHGAAGLAPHRRGRLSLGILPRTKSF